MAILSQTGEGIQHFGWNSNHGTFQKNPKVASPMPHENRGTLVLPLTHRKWRRAKNKTRTMAHKEAVTTTSSSTTSPKQPPRLVLHWSSRNVRARPNELHIYVWRLPSSVDLLTPRFSVCARPSCAPEYAPGSVEHHQTAQLSSQAVDTISSVYRGCFLKSGFLHSVSREQSANNAKRANLCQPTEVASIHTRNITKRAGLPREGSPGLLKSTISPTKYIKKHVLYNITNISASNL